MSLLEDTVRRIEPADAAWRSKARERIDDLTMPKGALGRLLELAEDLAAMTRTLRPPVDRKAILTMAGDHGVVAEGVSLYPQEVTAQMVCNFVAGGAGINVLARLAGAKVLAVDMGVAADLSELAETEDILDKKVRPGTDNIARGPAMTREEAMRAIEGGIEAVHHVAQKGLDVLGTGDMGIGNTTPSSAIVAAITRRPVREVTGRGTGLDDDALNHKVRVIERAIDMNRPDPDDPLDVLAKVGGFEIGGLAGAVLGAAAQRIPVIIDGLISSAGALIATELAPQAKGYVIASHQSVEIGHRAIHEHMGVRPYLDLELRLGEGTGAALAMYLVDAAVKILTEMATFSEAGVSRET